MADLFTIHFWLICGAWVGGVGALYLRSRLRSNAESGGIEYAEIGRFCAGWFVAIMMPCAILWGAQLSAGSTFPEYLRWPSPQKWIALGVNVICWMLLLWWVWLSNGANVLSKMFTAARPRYYPAFLYSTVAIKAFSVILVVAGVATASGAMDAHAV